MKQIYYTQCPIGYGLGASNGFQIKRLSPGYPISGDFRHLGLRAFLAGTRTLAPPALRYRRDETGQAEVAWLSPRTHEYETERGCWGRPGGHFAHGLQLDDDELQRIDDWPAGLYDQGIWTRADPSPTRGQHPGPLELSPSQLRGTPDFDTAAALAAGEDTETLARLLTALSVVAREGRTLFLIDEPARLGARIGLLTLAFPAPWRGSLTFSTYHDRPEELPGFRIQGTIPAVRPNRNALLGLGFVADLTTRTISPEVTPARWATILARWLVERRTVDCGAWEATALRARVAGANITCESFWTDEWLDRLYGFDPLVRSPGPRPESRDEWQEIAETAAWAGRFGLAEEWVDARPPAWWQAAADRTSEARFALLTLLQLPQVWQGEDRPRAWGEAVAAWLRICGPIDRMVVIEAAFNAAPEKARPGLIRSLIGALPEAESAATLEWLKNQPGCDRNLLLPLEVVSAIDQALGRNDSRPLRGVLTEALARPEVLRAVLESLAAEARVRPETLGVAASALEKSLAKASPSAASQVIRWGLGRGGEAGGWLGRFLRRTLADPHDLNGWRTIRDQTDGPLRGALARVVLETAQEAALPEEAFRWGVEEVLLPIPANERPHDPGWPGAYLERNGSDRDLIAKVFAREHRHLGLKGWLEAARERGELTPAQQQRLAECRQYVQALRSGDPRSLRTIRLPAVPPEERGALLGQILSFMRAGSDEALDLVLDVCRDAWPEAFGPGTPGLDNLARALADPLLECRGEPQRWFERLLHVLERLGLTAATEGGLEPDGLAAAIVAETARREGPGFDPWALRRFLLQHDAAWRLLEWDVRRDLEGQPRPIQLDALERWDRSLAKGLHTARFFEVWLNACDGHTLALAVAKRIQDLLSLGVLEWWSWGQYPEARNDLRDAFAQCAPMAPVAEYAYSTVWKWLESARGADPAAERLSARGLVRWRSIAALSTVFARDADAEMCWQAQAAWRHSLPLGKLDELDRYRFVAWLIFRLESHEAHKIARLARWLFVSGVTDSERLGRWVEELEGLVAVPDATRAARFGLVRELSIELKNVIRDARERAGKSRIGDSP